MKRVVAPLVLLPLLHGVAASQPAGVPDHTVPPGANYDKAEFRLNKGGIYYSALVPRAARAVPALLFVGDKDPAFRTSTIAGLFAVNRRAGALWALAIEPDTAHAVGRSRDLGAMFFADVMALRLASGALTPVDASAGFIGDLTAATIQPAAGAAAPAVPGSRSGRLGGRFDRRPQVREERHRRIGQAIGQLLPPEQRSGPVADGEHIIRNRHLDSSELAGGPRRRAAWASLGTATNGQPSPGPNGNQHLRVARPIDKDVSMPLLEQFADLRLRSAVVRCDFAARLAVELGHETASYVVADCDVSGDGDEPDVRLSALGADADLQRMRCEARREDRGRMLPAQVTPPSFAIMPRAERTRRQLRSAGRDAMLQCNPPNAE